MSQGDEPQSSNVPPLSDDADFRSLVVAFRTAQSEQQSGTSYKRVKADSIEAALTCPEQLDQLLLAMFPDGVPAGSEFYRRLHLLGEFVDIGNPRDRVLGRVWSTALQRVNESTSEEILWAFAQEPSHDLFGLFGALDTVLWEHELRPAFVADLFSALAERIERDLAQGVFWKAAKTFCEHHTLATLHALPHLIDKPSDTRLGIASFIIGTLRNLPLPQPERDAFNAFEGKCTRNPTSQIRALIIRSWVTTAWQTGIKLAELEALLSRYGEGSTEEVDCLFCSVCRLVPITTAPRDVFEAGLNWLRHTVNSSISSTAKFALTEMLVRIAQRDPLPDDPVFESTFELLRAIQPIPVEDSGTWQEVEAYLVALLDRDFSAFKSVFLALVRNDAAGFYTVIQKPRSFEWLLSRMSGQDIAEPISRLIVSSGAKCRQLGLYLFDRLNVDALPASALDAAGDRGVRLAFYELQRNLLSGEAMARVLTSLLPRIESTDPELKSVVFYEVLFQSLSLAKGFRGELEKRATDSPLVKQVIEHLSRYHEALKRANSAHINSMDIPWFARAAGLYRRRFSKQVSDSAKEHSIILQLVKHVSLLYGSESGSYIDGRLSGPSPLSEFSHTMELPVLAFSDPEGMTLRRWQTSQRLAELEKESSPDEATEGQ